MRDRLEQLVAEMVQKGIRFDDALEEFERRFIACALAQSKSGLAETAERLGMHRNTLSRKMQEYRIKRKMD